VPRSTYFAIAAALGALLGCDGGETSIGAHRIDRPSGGSDSGGSAGAFGAAGGGSGGGAGTPCVWSRADGLVAEWRANGSTDNEVACSPLEAELLGNISFGPGREGEAFRFRSSWSSVSGGDPNYVALRKRQDFALTQLTIDAWVQQTHFNDYNNSNRLIFSTSYRNLNGMFPGETSLYVHENMGYYAHVTTGSGGVEGRDHRGCWFPSLGPLETLPPLETWFRLTATYDGVAVRCYFNGALDDEVSLPRLEPGSTELEPLMGRNFPGDVDALRVFDRALTAAEIAEAWP
jgi:hypothetical protein